MIGTREIVFAVLATTATLIAVFVPISFMPGIVGNLFSEFGFVLAFAVTISSLVALTVCPMLAAKLGASHTPPSADKAPGLFTRLSNALGTVYARVLDICLRLRLIVLAVCLGFAALGWLAYKMLPQEITPPEDRSVIQISLRAQQGANWSICRS